MLITKFITFKSEILKTKFYKIKRKLHRHIPITLLGTLIGAVSIMAYLLSTDAPSSHMVIVKLNQEHYFASQLKSRTICRSIMKNKL
jgi:hypothetical protein